jgi:S-adenosylmethionine hydrolase
MIGASKVRCPLAEFYATVPVNRPVAVVGSSGLVEFAVNGGSAARQFGLKIGDKVTVRVRS